MGPWKNHDPLNDKPQRCVLRLSPQNYACLIVSVVVYKQLEGIAFKRTSVFDTVVQNYCAMQVVHNKYTLDKVLRSVNEVSPNAIG